MEIKEKWIDALSMLTERESARVLWAIVKYNRTGEVASLKSVASRIALSFIISEIESDRRKADEAAERSEKMRSLVAKRYGAATEAPTHVDTNEPTHVDTNVDTNVTTHVESPVDAEKEREKSPTPPKREDKEIIYKNTKTSFCAKSPADEPISTSEKKSEKAIPLPPSKIQYAEFVSMTEDEHDRLLERFGEKDVGWMIERLDNYKGSSGKKYKNDYRAILTWVVQDMENNRQKQLQYGNNIEKSKRGRFETSATCADDYKTTL